MTDLAPLRNWMGGYVRAWNSNDPAEIGALFAEDGQYFTAPFRQPWRGRDAIVAGWLERQDEPGQTRFRWDPVIVTDELCVVQGVTEYLTVPPSTFSNLWLIRLDQQGQCVEFTEWWMEQPASDGSG
jgi:hypothetical protein